MKLRSCSRELRPAARRFGALLLVVACLLGSRTARAATFVVNSVADTDDGVCGDGQCTLREAINAANAQPGFDLIIFLIRPFDTAVKTIRPLAPLPLLADDAGVSISALSQPGSSGSNRTDGTSNAKLLVEIDGSDAGTGTSGLFVAGGPSRIEGLVLNRFSAAGIVLAGGSGHEVVGNFVGTSASGLEARGNGLDGIDVLVPDCVLSGNLISGNGIDGAELIGESERTKVEGNLIGVDAAGVPRLGNRRAGVAVFTASNRIGGLAAGSGNYIGGNLDVGLVCVTADAQDNVIQSNSIFDNHSHGVMITVDAARNRVARSGGFPQPSNTILRNGGNGVCVTESAGTPNPVLPFRIDGNELIGIDFTGGEEDAYGVTPNDALDADHGPNELQNWPVLEEAVTDGTHTWVYGEFSGVPFADLVVSFYAGASCHPSGHGDGRMVGGGFVTETDSEGESRGKAEIDAREGEYVSAVAMDGEGNSSELSNCIRVVAGPTRTEAPSPSPTAPPADTATPTLAPDTPTSTPAADTPTPPPTETVVDTPTESPTLPATATATAVPLAGDANCDGTRSAADLTATIAQIGIAASICGADANLDGVVDASDLRLSLADLFE